MYPTYMGEHDHAGSLIVTFESFLRRITLAQEERGGSIAHLDFADTLPNTTTAALNSFFSGDARTTGITLLRFLLSLILMGSYFSGVCCCYCCSLAFSTFVGVRGVFGLFVLRFVSLVLFVHCIVSFPSCYYVHTFS
jgi:hypothetical protein